MYQFAPHLEHPRIQVRQLSVDDGDADFPRRRPFDSERLRTVVRRNIQRRGQRWYHLSDLVAELHLVAPWLLGKIDVLHYLDGEHTAQYLPAIWRGFRRRGVSVATFHQPPSVLPNIVVPEVLRHLDLVTVVASSQLEYFRKVLPDDRVQMLPYGVDTTFFTPAARRPSSGFRCVSVGSYLRDWGLFREIVHRLREHRNIEWDVVSDSAPAINLPRFRVHRNIDDNALRELYARSDAAILPLSDATANNALLESMAMGLPVVATDLPSVREYGTSEAMLLVPPTADAFVRAIVLLIDDAARREAMGNAGRRRAKDFAWPTVARHYQQLYERLA
jgi:glycosyltransferase involved in cell wall biosynthesis